jgi:hypothetical protein
MADRLAKAITIYTHGSDTTTTALTEALASKPLTIERRKIAKLERLPESEGLIVHFEDGTSKHERFLVCPLSAFTLSVPVHSESPLTQMQQKGTPPRLQAQRSFRRATRRRARKRVYQDCTTLSRNDCQGCLCDW